MMEPMMNGMMTLCMAASALFALAILIVVVVQTVVQVKLLREVRRFHNEK